MRLPAIPARWVRGLAAFTLACAGAPGWAQPAPELPAPPAAETAPAEQAAPAAEAVAPAETEAQAPAQALAQAKAEPATLAEVLERVWLENPEVNQSLRALEAAGFDIASARAGYYPYASIQTALAERQENSSTTLSLVLPLWSGGATKADVDQAKGREAEALASLARTRLSVAQRTAEAYLGILQTQEQTLLWNRHLAALNQLLASIERRAARGVAPDADVQIAVTRLRQAQAGAESTRAQLLASRASLLSLLGSDPQRIKWPDENYMLSDAEIDTADQRSDLHPLTQIATAQLSQQEASAREARARLWPDFSLQHRRQLEGLTFDPTNDDATLLVAQFQTSNGLRGFRGYQAEQQRIEGAKSRVDAAKREVVTALITGRAQLRAASAQLLAQEQAVAASDLLVDSFSRQFEVGRKSWLELLNAHREAQDARLQFVSIKRNYWQANVRLALEGIYWHRLGLGEMPADDAAKPDAAEPAGPAEAAPAAQPDPQPVPEPVPEPVPAPEPVAAVKENS